MQTTSLPQKNYYYSNNFDGNTNNKNKNNYVVMNPCIPKFRCNNYGTIMQDLTRPFDYLTKLYQFEHPNECMQYQNTVIQNNRFAYDLPDIELVQVESELRGITRKFSYDPKDHYNPYTNPGYIPKPPIKPNSKECRNKIVDSTIQKTRDVGIYLT